MIRRMTLAQDNVPFTPPKGDQIALIHTGKAKRQGMHTIGKVKRPLIGALRKDFWVHPIYAPKF